MKKEQELRLCLKHGETLFSARSNGKGGIKWRCVKCENEAVLKRREEIN